MGSLRKMHMGWITGAKFSEKFSNPNNQISSIMVCVKQTIENKQTNKIDDTGYLCTINGSAWHV